MMPVFAPHPLHRARMPACMMTSAFAVHLPTILFQDERQTSGPFLPDSYNLGQWSETVKPCLSPCVHPDIFQRLAGRCECQSLLALTCFLERVEVVELRVF